MTDSAVFDVYTIKKANIASGGAGVVHDAVSPDGRRVAIKVLNRESVEKKLAEIIKKKKPGIEKNSDEFATELRRLYELNVDEFKSEYQWLARLNHPHVAKVYGTGFHEGRFYIVYEFIDGKPLASHVHGWKPVEMIPLFIQALSGLDYIHRNGIIHLDIKSENILVQIVEGRPVVKIIDFGVAVMPEEYKGGVRGTIETMAPEVALGQKELVDARADLFSFAAVMYHCITWGVRFPFPRPTTSDMDFLRHYIQEREPALEVKPPCHVHRRREGFAVPFLDTVVMRLLAHDPKDRFYGNARAVINALATHLPDSFQDSSDALGSYLRPEMNRYIGRDKEVEAVESNVRALIEGKSPVAPIFRIAGAKGLGKTHFLNHIRETAERHVDKISIHTITLPTTQEALESKIAILTRELSENTRPVLVLVDNLEELDAPLSPGGRGSGRGGSEAISAISGLARLIAEHKRSETTYSDIQEAMLVFTTDVILRPRETSCLPKDPVDTLADTLPPDLITTIELKPFTAVDIEAYLQATPALKGKPIDHARAEALHRRTAGIPRELVDTLQDLDSRGVLFDASGELVLADLPAMEVGARSAPQSTRERLLNQYREFSPPERCAADVLACWCARPFLPLPREEDISGFVQQYAPMQAIHTLVQKEVIRHDDDRGTYAFAENDYLPSLIHDEMDEATRDAIHSAIANYLSTPPLPRRERGGERVVMFHLAFGSDPRAAIRNCVILGRNLLYKQGKCSTAIELFERALQCVIASEARQSPKAVPPGNWKLKAYVYSLLAEAYYYYERPAEVAQAISDGLAICQSIPWRISLKLRLAAYCLNWRRLDKARETIDELKDALAHRKKTIAYPLMLNNEARYYYELSLSIEEKQADQIHRAKELFQEGELIEKIFSSDSIKRINNNSLYVVLRSLGDYSLAAEKAKKRIKDREMNIFTLMVSSGELAEIYRFAHKYDQALNYAQKALFLAKEAALGRYINYSYGVLANIYHDMDDFESSIDACNHRLAAGACITGGDEYKRLSAHIWNQIGHCYKELKNWNKAVVYFDAVIGDVVDDYLKMSAHEGLMRVYFEKADYAQALKNFVEAKRLLERLPHNSYFDSHRFRILMLKAETHLADNDHDKALSFMTELRQLAGSDPKKLEECDFLEKKIAEFPPQKTAQPL